MLDGPLLNINVAGSITLEVTFENSDRRFHLVRIPQHQGAWLQPAKLRGAHGGADLEQFGIYVWSGEGAANGRPLSST